MFKILFSVFLILPNLASAEPNIGEKNYTLSCHKAGDIEIGMQVEAVYSIIGKDNTKLTDLYLEGAFSPAMEIYYEDIQSSQTPSLVAEISTQKTPHAYNIDRITVYDQRFKTKEGIGVGATLGDVKQFYRVDRMGYGEGTAYAIVGSLCMSFELPSVWYDVLNSARTAGLDLMPDTAIITSILIL